LCTFHLYVAIFQQHLHIEYIYLNPLKGILILISSLKLSIVPYEAGPESRGHSRTAYGYISISSCFQSFIVRWILNFVDQPTHKNQYTTDTSKSASYLDLHLIIDSESVKNKTLKQKRGFKFSHCVLSIYM
jgi:hypothetical protein